METEQSPEIPAPNVEPVPERASDMDMAFFLIRHIDNPCEVGTAPGVVANIRDFYIREAERVLPNINNPGAKSALESKIEQYKNN